MQSTRQQRPRPTRLNITTRLQWIAHSSWYERQAPTPGHGFAKHENKVRDDAWLSDWALQTAVLSHPTYCALEFLCLFVRWPHSLRLHCCRCANHLTKLRLHNRRRPSIGDGNQCRLQDITCCPHDAEADCTEQRDSNLTPETVREVNGACTNAENKQHEEQDLSVAQPNEEASEISKADALASKIAVVVHPETAPLTVGAMVCQSWFPRGACATDTIFRSKRATLVELPNGQRGSKRNWQRRHSVRRNSTRSVENDRCPARQEQNINEDTNRSHENHKKRISRLQQLAQHVVVTDDLEHENEAHAKSVHPATSNHRRHTNNLVSAD